MDLFIKIIHVLVALFMILVVLVQGGHQGGVGAAFGGGNSSSAFGASGATTLLGKLTYGAAFVFMLTTLSLVVLEGKAGKVGLTEQLEQQAKQKAVPTENQAQPVPATDTAPAADAVKNDAGGEVTPSGSSSAQPEAEPETAPAEGK